VALIKRKPKPKPKPPPKRKPKPKPKPPPPKPPVPAPPPAGGGGGTTTTTAAPGSDETGGLTATSGDLTSGSTTAPTPGNPVADQADQDIEAFFSTGTGTAMHYHGQPQQAESPAVQDTGAPQ
jgi:outer membrane biosynthesis protein TonB